jgi:hypothetical protein
MYTNIKTDPALSELSSYLRDKRKEFSYPCDALIKALDLVFRNNYFKFGDLYCKQVSGTAMGTPPAPPYATVTYGRHEDVMLPRWRIELFFYKRFIDDVFAIWLLQPDVTINAQRWAEFKADMNGWNGLEWVCEEPTTVVNFMDLTIRIVDGKLQTTIYEKAQNLYLYIPPHSSHPKGVLTGLIFGQVLRIRVFAPSRLTPTKRSASSLTAFDTEATPTNHSSLSSAERKPMLRSTSTGVLMTSNASEERSGLTPRSMSTFIFNSIRKTPHPVTFRSCGRTTCLIHRVKSLLASAKTWKKKGWGLANSWSRTVGP